MALLTEHDVLHKKFQTAKFRQDGYNQDEVDDFLDEVADTIRVLTNENEGLKNNAPASSLEGAGSEELARLREENAALQQRLEASNSANEGEDSGLRQENAGLRSRVSELEEQVASLQHEVTIARTEAERANAAQAASEGNSPEAATGMLALAQRLHDEYVRNGKEEGERIIANATGEGQRIVSEAEDQHARIIATLEEEKGKLEAKINDLRNFESDYRSRLTDYLQRLLGDVNNGAQS